MKTDRYFLLDLERTEAFDFPYFWKRNKHGYTINLDSAGKFPRDEAREIVKRDRNNNTVMIHVDFVQGIKELLEP